MLNGLKCFGYWFNVKPDLGRNLTKIFENMIGNFIKKNLMMRNEQILLMCIGPIIIMIKIIPEVHIKMLNILP